MQKFGILIVAIAIIWFDGSSRAGETENRLSIYELERADLTSRLSVDILFESMADIAVTGGTGGASWVQRYCIADQGKKQRIDAQRMDLGSWTFFPNLNQHESQLLLERECFYTNSMSERWEIKRFEVKAGITESQSDTKRCHPFDIAFGSGTTSRDDFRPGVYIAKIETVIDEQQMPNGTFVSLCLFKHDKVGFAAEYFFKKEPNEWVPFRFKLYRDPKQGKTTKPSAEQIRKWNCYFQSETEWIDDDVNKRHLPKKVSMDAAGNGYSYSRQYFFRNWKFGKELPEDVFDPNKFTVDKIKNAVDFNSIRAAFKSEAESESRTQKR